MTICSDGQMGCRELPAESNGTLAGMRGVPAITKNSPSCLRGLGGVGGGVSHIFYNKQVIILRFSAIMQKRCENLTA